PDPDPLPGRRPGAELSRAADPGALRLFDISGQLMSDSAEIFMRRAIELSLEQARSGAGGPFGAVIVRDGRIIAEGANRVTPSHDPTAHAEIVAIRNACAALHDFSLAGCEIYTSCEPCPMCLAAIYWARLDRIHYANDRADAAGIGFDDAFLYEEI